MSTPIIINEVGLRDGLQNQPRLVPTGEKLRLLDALLASGIRHVEATSFVSPKLVPQMADAADLCAALPQKDTVDYSVLVPNVKGYERAIAAGMTSVAVVLACTNTMNEKNIGMTLADATEVCATVMRKAKLGGVTARAYLAVAFVCPFEGPVDPARVAELAHTMKAAGADEIIVADTIGAANPVEVASLFTRLMGTHAPQELSAHFHDTQGLAMANAYAALERGILKFDSAIGGLGGCPFAPGAAGNAATEDLVNMLEKAGISTGVDLDRLVHAVSIAEQSTGAKLGGRWLDWRRSQETRRARPS